MQTIQKTCFSFGAVALLLTGTRLGAEPANSVSYWPLKQGSTWTLTTTVQNKTFDQVITVTDVKADKGGSVATLGYTMAGNNIQVETYRTTPTEVTRLSSGQGGSGTIAPGLPIIKYPMKAGTTWTWKGNITANGMLSKGTSTLTVSGPTSIKTPAGTFSAMRVHSALVIMAQGQTLNAPNDYWFAPNVGLVKQYAKIGTFEVTGILKSYKLK